ncbi:hypothetical protein COX24_01020 [bacterium (Candidatus Gribaldobacteria) CG23_combo_of_CG06-09_8_20_14_all_37_87_8]|uniref:Transposase IS66 central domain-containing protein n=1 Tax=bacterium (Candidatus Gribaldobacteria) CG23_combo_of_CG06-09_8_20_14_all_37_87_8 TaxID=2014278 RepID=A0A2G9ZFG4_9BACT|nr:MAG: hypothetical protein AUJ25_01310 [Parcubacteria group bacterium CG1_02_37_13]PIP31913.1 MAG: hypothetical protein COX24_01020 [bacterium (Candidatus Gribaldobacteria) CG23_combo_of_CG06-09_8_20_14_all_37_87_8]
MAVKLNKNEIKQRLIKLRNFGMLHPKVRKKVKLLEQQIKLLKEENTTLKALVAEQKLLIEKLRLRIEELEQMVFGYKKPKAFAQNLKGHFNQVGVSDDYGAYRNLFKYHQLCWAHPLRKLKDLSLSGTLKDKKRGLCLKTHQGLRALHEELKISVARTFDLLQRQVTKSLLFKKFQEIIQPDQDDPEKLKKIKTALSKNKDKYFNAHRGKFPVSKYF